MPTWSVSDFAATILLVVSACGTRGATMQAGLAGSAWVLEDLAVAGVVAAPLHPGATALIRQT